MRRRARNTLLTPVPCPCAGTMQPVRMSRYDISAELGVRVLLVGQVLGLRCDSCGAVAIPGTILETAAEVTVLHLLELQRRLSGREAQFLRKAVLACSQVDLATRMGLSRPTVARWEVAQSLTAEQDFNLRALLFGYILRANRLGRSRWARSKTRISRVAETQLQAARHQPAPKRVPPLEIRPAA
jgi:hypothetical protein